MIEKWITNEDKLKKWRRFKANRLALASAILLLIISFFSITAEVWSNSKPVIMKYDGKIYFPAIKQYHPSVFGIEDDVQTNYRMLAANEQMQWAVWPINEWDPFESNKEVSNWPSAPSNENWFGTDESGRDVMSRLLYGYRYSMAYAVFVFVLTSILAIVLGGVMGFMGGWVDIIGQRLVEIISSVPYLFILIIVASIFQPNLTWLVVISSLLGWVFMSYYIRAEFLRNRKMEFVEAAHALGASKIRIIFSHVLPNSLGPLISFAPFLIAAHITGLAGLDYLGFGLQPPSPSWGELLNQAQQYFSVAWWLAVYPSLALFACLVLLSLIGDGVRDALKSR